MQPKAVGWSCWMYEGTGMRYKTGKYYWIKVNDGDEDWEIGKYSESQAMFLDTSFGPGFQVLGSAFGLSAGEIFQIGPEAVPPTGEEK